MYKWRGDTWQDGSALHYALNLDLYGRAFAGWLLQLPWLLTWLTHAVLWFETLCPLLLFCPVWIGPIRTVVSLCVMLMHLAFSSLWYLELFPAVSAVAMTLFLPSWCCDRFTAARPSARAEARRGERAWWAEATAAALLFLVCLWVVAQWIPSRLKLPRALRNLGTLLYLDQTWTMFAPNPAKVSGWVVVPGVLHDGTRVDVSRDGAPVGWEKPPQRSLFKNERWRKYLIHVILRRDQRVERGYATYLCRAWNSRHAGDQRLDSLEITLMTRRTPPVGEPEPYRPQVLLRYACQP